MRQWFHFPKDNTDRAVRRWLRATLSETGASWSMEERECAALADRLMAGLDDRHRATLEAVDRRYDEGELDRLGGWLDRLVSGEPVQHVVGWTEFRGLRLACDASALIPRPETEEVVTWFLEGVDRMMDFRRRKGPVKVVDFGTGSGCIALAIKAARPHWEVWALDVSDSALALARANGAALGLEVNWVQGDLLAGAVGDLPQSVDGLVSNPPYIPLKERADMDAHVRDKEPALALFVPDADPLCFYRALAVQAERLLQEGGCLLAECHFQFTRQVADCWQLEAAETEVLSDLQGAERAVRQIRH